MTQAMVRILFVATTTLACTNGVDGSEFQANVCDDLGYRPLKGVTAGVRVDYMELHHAFGATAKEGTPCPNGTPCALELFNTRPAVGWTTPNTVGKLGPLGPNYLVFTRGDDVGVVTSIPDLKAFLAPIENGHDAALVVTESLGHTLLCQDDNVRAVDGGFEVATQSGVACGAGTHVDEHVVFVATNGDVTIRQTFVVETGSSSCSL